MNSLSGKVALITGASRGIGAAIAVELAKRGASKIAITYLSNASAAEETVQRIEEHGARGVAIKADASDLKAAPSVIADALAALNASEIDILVNNAANALLRPIEAIKVEDFAEVFNTNVGGTLFLIQAALGKIRRGGRIINVGSRLARLPAGSPFFLYAASKAALENLTRNLAFQFAAPLGITVNTVMPGPTDTDGMVLPKDVIERLKSEATAEKRLGTVDDIAQVVAFIAEDGSRWINGDTINATGGSIMW